MEKYTFKSIKYYNEIKKLYNINELTVIWHDKGAPSRKIGKCVESFVSWLSTATNLSYKLFGEYYLSNTKSLQDIEILAYELEELFKQQQQSFVGLENKILNHENIVDLIILHAVIETYNGGFSEQILKMYLNKCGKNVKKANGLLDIRYGIDLIILNKDGKTESGLQVKPISFFLGKKDDLIKDREKVFKSFEELKINDNFNINRMFFIVWKYVDDEIKFLDYGDGFGIFHEFSNLNDMMSKDWHGFCNRSDVWKSLAI